MQGNMDVYYQTLNQEFESKTSSLQAYSCEHTPLRLSDVGHCFILVGGSFTAPKCAFNLMKDLGLGCLN